MLTSGFQNRPTEAAGSGGANLFAPAEADIMRLVAVLALCLMLLFSAEQHFAERPELVETPAMDELQEPKVTETVRSAEPPSEQLTMQVEPATTATPVPVRSEVSPVAAQLYFSSDVALLSLLVRQRIAVYTERGGQWREVSVDNVRAVELPREPVYQLRADTVPKVLRDRADHFGAAEKSRWAIWLEPSINQEVMTQIGGGEGRSIVIEATGMVRSLATESEAIDE